MVMEYGRLSSSTNLKVTIIQGHLKKAFPDLKEDKLRECYYKQHTLLEATAGNASKFNLCWTQQFDSYYFVMPPAQLVFIHSPLGELLREEVQQAIAGDKKKLRMAFKVLMAVMVVCVCAIVDSQDRTGYDAAVARGYVDNTLTFPKTCDPHDLEALRENDVGDLFEASNCKAYLGELNLDTCCDLFLLQHFKSDPYTIRGNEMYCDVTPEAIWSVIMRRSYKSSQSKYTKDWRLYTRGFGNTTRSHWIGLELIHNLTALHSAQLRIELWNKTSTTREVVMYENFRVLGNESQYELQISGFSTNSSTLEDMFSYHDGVPFSTHDNIGVDSGVDCLDIFKGGWWYANCFTFLPTGEGYPIMWGSRAFEKVEMKIRSKTGLCYYNVTP